MESRPVRWRSAVRRALAAVQELDRLREKIVAVREEIEESWTQQREKLDHALLDLIRLQSEYESLGVPDNLSSSRTQDKLYDVTGLYFKNLHGSVPSIDALFEPLENFNPTEDFTELHHAETVDLPKFYGRD